MKIRKAAGSAPVDWDVIHKRLALTAQALHQSAHASAERTELILRERARALACVPDALVPAGEALTVLTFGLSAERYAVETQFVREVVRLTDFTPVPGTPNFVTGLISLRGEILALIDLRKFLGLSEYGISDLSRVVVLGQERPEFGVLADVAYEIETVSVAEVLAPPATVVGTGREYLRGVTRDALMILDGSVLLNDARLFVDQSDEIT